jgi:hypothetical protein
MLFGISRPERAFLSHMEESSLYVPKPIAEQIDAVHRQHGRATDPKWRTVAQAVMRFAQEEARDE